MCTILTSIGRNNNMAVLLLLVISISYTLAAPSNVDTQWNDFKVKYSKTYESEKEETYRLGIFQENLKKIEEHNKLFDQGLSTYKMGINKFADLTEEEFIALSGLIPPKRDTALQDMYKAEEDNEVPDSIDWREKNAVNEVRDQGQCGSCWAFAAVETLESILFVKINRLVTLSTQNVIDCATPYGAQGCKGGLMTEAYDYIKENGIMYDVEYPYVAKDEECKFNSTRSALRVESYVQVEDSEKALKSAIATVGPIGVTVSTKEWHLYEKGILIAKEKFDHATHAVVAVGYGTEDGVDYWILRNSFGKSFGEDGYIRVARSQGESIGVTSHAIYPTLYY